MFTVETFSLLLLGAMRTINRESTKREALTKSVKIDLVSDAQASEHRTHSRWDKDSGIRILNLTRKKAGCRQTPMMNRLISGDYKRSSRIEMVALTFATTIFMMHVYEPKYQIKKQF